MCIWGEAFNILPNIMSTVDFSYWNVPSDTTSLRYSLLKYTHFKGKAL